MNEVFWGSEKEISAPFHPLSWGLMACIWRKDWECLSTTPMGAVDTEWQGPSLAPRLGRNRRILPRDWAFIPSHGCADSLVVCWTMIDLWKLTRCITYWLALPPTPSIPIILLQIRRHISVPALPGVACCLSPAVKKQIPFGGLACPWGNPLARLLGVGVNPALTIEIECLLGLAGVRDQQLDRWSEASNIIPDGQP